MPREEAVGGVLGAGICEPRGEAGAGAQVRGPQVRLSQAEPLRGGAPHVSLSGGGPGATDLCTRGGGTGPVMLSPSCSASSCPPSAPPPPGNPLENQILGREKKRGVKEACAGELGDHVDGIPLPSKAPLACGRPSGQRAGPAACAAGVAVSAQALPRAVSLCHSGRRHPAAVMV